MYSEVLDELFDYDVGCSTHDRLPVSCRRRWPGFGQDSRIPSVCLFQHTSSFTGSQREIDRSAEEMMTRAPVKVTISEGPYHITHFKDSSREFDLGKQSDLSDLPKEVHCF